MINIFKQNIFVISLLLLPYTVVMRWKGFMVDAAYVPSTHEGGLNAWLFNWLDTPFSQNIAGIFFIYIQALLINRVGINHKINKEIGLLPGMFYILFASMILGDTGLTPVIVANFFIILSLQFIFLTYNRKEVSQYVFMCGIYASIASLFYFPYLYFFIVTTAGLLIMRSFSFKERFQHMIGWILPYVLLWVWQFYTASPRSVLPHYFLGQYGIFNLEWHPDMKGLVLLIFALVTITYFVLSYAAIQSKKPITVQKKIDIFYWVLLYGGVSVIFYNYVGLIHLNTVALPVGYFLAMSITQIKSPSYQELVHLMILGVLVYVQYF